MKRILFFMSFFITIWLASASFPAADPDWDGQDIQMIFYGDSRTQGMAMCAGGCTYVGKTGAGYAWMSGDGYTYLKEAMEKYPEATVIFCFGVNDLGNVDSYIQFFRDFTAVWPERECYFASVNPIADQYAAANGYSVRNVSVEAFNDRVMEELPDAYLDTYTFLAAGGFDTVDGVHYGSETYIEIQNLTMVLVESRRMEKEWEETTELPEEEKKP